MRRLNSEHCQAEEVETPEWTESGSPLFLSAELQAERRAEQVTPEPPENYMDLTNHSHIHQP